MQQAQMISRQLAPGDLEAIAAMHLSPTLIAQASRHAGAQYRFYLDKIRLFQDFDPHSTLLEKDEAGQICGVLVYTHDEPAFHCFAGPRHGRFYLHLLKALLGCYGCHPAKYFVAARSMLGRGKVSSLPPASCFGKIWVLLVAEECRRQGVAGRLVGECLQAMRERGGELLRVTVRIDNLPAIKAYEKCGFRKVGQCMESYGLSDVMQLAIPAMPSGK